MNQNAVLSSDVGLKITILNLPTTALDMQGIAQMNWIARLLYERRMKDLKRRIAQMEMKAEEMEADRRMLTMDGTNGRILRERIAMLEKAVEKMESQRGAVIG